MVETNTTEDTDKKESNTVEVYLSYIKINMKHIFHFFLIVCMQNYKSGDDKTDGPDAIENGTSGVRKVSAVGATKLYNNRDDGLVREVKTTRAFSREEVDELLETEGVQHYGDFSDQVQDFATSQIKPLSSLIIIFGFVRPISMQ